MDIKNYIQMQIHHQKTATSKQTSSHQKRQNMIELSNTRMNTMMEDSPNKHQCARSTGNIVGCDQRWMYWE